MSITDIKGLEDGSWVNEPIIGRISSTKNMKTKTGKDMGVGKLGDDNDTIDITSFDKSFTAYDGKTVELSGAGIKKDSYNGYDKLMVGAKAVITVQDGDAPATQTKAATPAKPAAPKLTLESLADDFTGKLVVGYNIAESIVAELDGRVELTSEDRRSIAISFIIEANRRGL